LAKDSVTHFMDGPLDDPPMKF